MSRNLKLNWKYALGEVTLIFLGISLAVAFENFSRQRSKDKTQKLFLEEIRTDLYQDTLLLNNVLRVTENHINSIDALVAHFEVKAAYSDETGRHLAKALTFPRAPFISAGYQTLKSTDVTLVNDRKVRRPLVEYYEFMQPLLHQLMGDVEFEFKTYWTPWILENIIDFRYSRIAVPIDYERILNDPLLVRNLKISKDNNMGLLRNLQGAKQDVIELIALINEELGDMP